MWCTSQNVSRKYRNGPVDLTSRPLQLDFHFLLATPTEKVFLRYTQIWRKYLVWTSLTTHLQHMLYKPRTYGNLVLQYDEGRPEHVESTANWALTGALGSDDLDGRCFDSMLEIIHGCDTTSKWKNGGSVTWTDARNEGTYKFRMEPMTERPVPPEVVGRCDVWLKFGYDEFYIYGGGRAGNDHGQSQLLPNLRRCGIVSVWRFEYDDYSEKWPQDKIEWSAYGRLPIGSQQWDCVRRAVIDSGQPSGIGCGGS